MKKTASIFMVLTLIIGQMSAQIMDRIQLKGGIIYGNYLFSQATDSPYNSTVPISGGSYANFYFGAYYALFHKNDIVSLGIDAGIQPWLSFQDWSYQIQVPAYLVGRIGAGSTTYNQQKIGLGLGVGLQTAQRGYITNRFTDPLPKFFALPSAMAELCLGGNRNFIGRLYLSPFVARKYMKDIDSYFTVGNFGIGILYNFN